MTHTKSFEDRLAEMAGGTAKKKLVQPFETLASEAAEEQAPPRPKRGSVGLKLVLVTGLFLVLGAGAVGIWQGKFGNLGFVSGAVEAMDTSAEL